MTTKHLKLLIKVSSGLQNKKDHYQFIAMLAVAFYGFLRPSEYCITPSNHHLNWNDVQFSKKGKQVRLFLRSFKHSKGKSTIVLHPAKICCPIYWLKRYRSLFANCHHTPLFDMTAKDFHRVLKNLCDTAKIKTKLTPHSLRHGGASWASKQGWPDARIKAHGRWRSDAYKWYVRAFWTCLAKGPVLRAPHGTFGSLSSAFAKQSKNDEIKNWSRLWSLIRILILTTKLASVCSPPKHYELRVSRRHNAYYIHYYLTAII